MFQIPERSVSEYKALVVFIYVIIYEFVSVYVIELTCEI